MATSGSTGFAITISAVDRASKELDRINKRVAAFTAPIRRYQAVSHKFAEASGMNKIVRGLRNLGTGAITAAQRLSRVITPLRALTGAASVAGVYGLATSWANFTTRLDLAAQRIGTTANLLNGLQGAARLAGASAESMTAGMTHFKDALTDAVGGRNVEALRMLNTLFQGPGWQAGASNVEATFSKVADKIASLRDPSLQARAAMVLLGGAGGDLLPLMRLGSKGISELVAMTLRYSTVTQAQADAAHRLYVAQQKVELAVQGMVTVIGAALSPVLTPLLTQFAEWIKLNRSWIASDITYYIKEFSGYMRSIDWHAVGDDVRWVGRGILGVVNRLGGWHAALRDLLGFFVARFVVRMLGGIGTITLALRGAIGLMALLSRGVAATAMGAAGIGARAGIGGAAAAVGGSAALRALGPLGAFLATMWPSETGGGRSTTKPGESREMEELRTRGLAPRGTPLTQAYRPLLDLIGHAEGTDAHRGYNETLGYGKYTGGPQNLTGMTLAQVYALQDQMKKSGAPSTAVGRYQFLDSTLKGLAARDKLDPNTTMFTPALQDRLATEDITARGGVDFINQRISRAQFEHNLAREWASLPDPGTGRSAYGQGLGATGAQLDSTVNQVMAGPPSKLGHARPQAPAVNVRLPGAPTGQPQNVGDGAAGPAAAAAGPQGNVHVTFAGSLPPGVKIASTKATGNATTAAPRIESGMPLAAFP